MNGRYILLFVAALALSACKIAPQPLSFVKVYKNAGVIQCDQDSGVDLEVMELELTEAGILVYCSQKGDDGYGRPQKCGLGTGSINIYKINALKLPAAVDLGFSSVSNLSEIQYLGECE